MGKHRSKNKRFNINHERSLDYLINNLRLIDESLEKSVWVMKEGIYLNIESIARHPFPDLIIVYPKHAIPIELKGSYKDRGIEQIKVGKLFIERELKTTCPYGKFVIYNGWDYDVQKIEF